MDTTDATRQERLRPWWSRHWRILASVALLTSLSIVSMATGGRPPGILRAVVLFGIAAIYFPWSTLKFSLRTALIAMTLVAIVLGIGAWIFR